MQDQVGIVRNERDLRDALEGIDRLRDRAGRVAVSGNREYNPGWHTALDLRNLLAFSEAIARRRWNAGRVGGPTPVSTIPTRTRPSGSGPS